MSLASRVAKLESQTPKSRDDKRSFFAFYSDGEDPNIAEAEMKFRAENNVPADEPLQCIMIYSVSPEWYRARHDPPALS